jgi:hypothetical protein
LVYRQGWELTADALSRTDGWGVGFQQLGFVPFTSPTADMLHRLLFGDLNTLDGGFLAAKVMAELGFIGIALVAAYIVLVIKVGWRVRMSVARGTQLPSKVLFSSAVICGFSIELFVRGLGYFSGSAVLFVAAVLMALTNERERRARAPQARAFH